MLYGKHFPAQLNSVLYTACLLVRFCLFRPFMCVFNCVLKDVFVVVYCVWYVLCCCLHGVIKHDDDDDDNKVMRSDETSHRTHSAHRTCVRLRRWENHRRLCSYRYRYMDAGVDTCAGIDQLLPVGATHPAVPSDVSLRAVSCLAVRQQTFRCKHGGHHGRGQTQLTSPLPGDSRKGSSPTTTMHVTTLRYV